LTTPESEDTLKTTNAHVEAQALDLAKYALTLHLEAFNDRYDLFVKAVGLYIAIVGAVVGYITQDVGSPTKVGLSAFVAVSSVAALYACFVCWRWVRIVEKNVESISKRVGVLLPPLYDARMVQGIAATVFGCVLAASLMSLIYEYLSS
jgi:hypothetical protein